MGVLNLTTVDLPKFALDSNFALVRKNTFVEVVPRGAMRPGDSSRRSLTLPPGPRTCDAGCGAADLKDGFLEERSTDIGASSRWNSPITPTACDNQESYWQDGYWMQYGDQWDQGQYDCGMGNQCMQFGYVGNQQYMGNGMGGRRDGRFARPDDRVRERRKTRKPAGEKVFVGGLSSKTTDAALMKVFSKFGQVAHASVLVDAQFKRPRGFGYVTFIGDVPEGVVDFDHLIDGRMCGARLYNYKW